MLVYDHLGNCLNCGLGDLSSNVYCSQGEWMQANAPYYDWYYDNYPQLKENGVTLPISMTKLQSVYRQDMSLRNLTPIPEMESCYQNLFEYILARISGEITFEGQSFWEMTWNNLPGAIDKTFKDIGNVFDLGLDKIIPILLIIGAIMIFKK